MPDGTTATRTEAQGFAIERHAPMRGALTVTLDNPPLNVLTLAMMNGLTRLAGELSEDREIRVVIFRAMGKAFCAGADVMEQSANPASVMVGAIQRLCRAVVTLPQTTICQVDGACMGGGMELMLACDFVVASERATFGVPEITLGIFPPVAAVLLPRRIGWAAAKDLLFLGRHVDAIEAKELGLVLDAVGPEDVDLRTENLASRLLSYSAAALRALKKALRETSGKPLAEALETSGRVYLDDIVPTGDHLEGFRAFLEKRAPRWKNQ